MKVVICEDDKGILELVKFIIEELQFSVYTCTDSKSLKKYVLNNKVDLIIVDYWLKNERAERVIKEIKTEMQVPIILMSAANNLENTIEKLEVDDFVKKPFDIEEFKLKVKNIIYGPNNINNRR